MADPVTFAFVGSQVLGIYGGIQQSKAQLRQAYLNRELSRLNASRIKNNAAREAIHVKQEATKLRGTVLSRQAINEVLIHQGSSAAVRAQVENDAIATALEIEYSGSERAMAEKERGMLIYQQQKSAAWSTFYKTLANAAGQSATFAKAGG